MERALLSALDWWDVSGADVPEINPARRKPRARPATPQSTTPKAAPPTARAQPASAPATITPDERAVAAATLAGKAKTLTDLKTAIESFNAGALSDNARQAVFARGNPDADIMIIGEAPGAEEDRQGKPFVGASGQLLDRILASIGQTEDTLYITNVVNWRPPGNRKPTQDEIALCLPFIHRHIDLVQPKLIVMVGSASMGALAGMNSITKSRGQWVDISTTASNIPGLITYHPAYLLRQPHLKRDVWRDMLSLRARIEAL